MTKVEAIVRPEKLNQLKHELEEIDCTGMTVAQVMGAGNQAGYVERHRGMEYRIRLHAKIRVELVVPDPMVEQVVRTIRNACITGEIGDGKIFLYRINDAVRIRTGVHGNEAL
jgi:nitrogen regulatory protein P-II 1